jgi:hypothetical protein
MLSTAMSPQAYEATVKQLIKETEAAKASPGTTMEDIRGRITQTSKSGEGGKSVPASQAAESSPPPKPISVPSGSQYSPSLKQWRDPSGTIYDAMGQKVQ